MAVDTKTFNGALAIIKVKGVVVALMRNISLNETMTRQRVGGLGTILPKEQTVTQWDGTLTCDFMMINWAATGIPGGIRRDFANTASQVVTTGDSSFEDQLVLDADGVEVDIFKKVKDAVDSTGKIKPVLVPHTIVSRCLIDSDAFDMSEGNVGTRRQTFKYLDPVLFNNIVN